MWALESRENAFARGGGLLVMPKTFYFTLNFYSLEMTSNFMIFQEARTIYLLTLTYLHLLTTLHPKTLKLNATCKFMDILE